MDIFRRNISLAIEGVAANKFRAFLTALGIVFGVAAVIAMMAIGKGAQQSILEQLEEIGTNNIIITAITPEDQEEAAEGSDEESEQKKFSPGLSMNDVYSLQSVIPNLESLSPELVIKDRIVHGSVSKNGICMGVWNDYFDIFNLNVEQGSRFTTRHLQEAMPVCIIGSDIQQKYFKNAPPLGKRIKVGYTWFAVVGVLERKSIGNLSQSSLNVKDHNTQIFIPASTAIRRIEDRSRVNQRDLGNRRGRSGPSKNYHQIDRVVLKVQDNDALRGSADIAKRLINRRHNDVEDVNFDIPELLIKQRQSTQQTLNFVLAIIAGISLLVGGIGIMNIMLASVLERIREIGIRRSVGAGKADISFQFLLEATLISLIGGLLGIIIGIGAAEIIAGSAEIQTSIDMWSIVLSFGVAVGIGLIFGYVPAQRASKLDPVKALRSD